MNDNMDLQGIKESMAQMSEMFNKRMIEFNEDLKKTSTTTSLASPPSRLASDFTAFRSFVITSLQCLQTQIDCLYKLYESQEMRSRRKILLLHGVPENNDENVTSQTLNILSTKMKLPNLSINGVSRCHRLGNPKDNKPRPILIKLRDLSDKELIWSSKTNLKGTGITLSEFLTKNRHDVFMAAREQFGVTKCWTRNGHIFVIGPGGVRHRVESIADIKALSAVAPDKPNPGTSAVSSIPSKDNKVARSRRLNVKAK
ncbi:unnamed protein product [Colias eurytheme]|nr:unnamed protein product [Colias eurytheme]